MFATRFISQRKPLAAGASSLPAALPSSIVRQRLHVIYATDETGRRAYYCLLLNPSKHAQFAMDCKKHASVSLTDYGHIIHSGYGDQLPDTLRATLKSEYGWEGNIPAEEMA